MPEAEPLCHTTMIETSRLQIRPLTASELQQHLDSPAAFALSLGVTPSVSLLDPETRDAILNDLLPHLNDPAKDARFYTMWILIEKAQKAIIGGICFHGEPDDEGVVEIGYGTDPEYQNKGYMTETIAGMIGWLRLQKQVRAIIAETEKSNLASIKVLNNNGFMPVKEAGEAVLLRLEMV